MTDLFDSTDLKGEKHTRTPCAFVAAFRTCSNSALIVATHGPPFADGHNAVEHEIEQVHSEDAEGIGVKIPDDAKTWTGLRAWEGTLHFVGGSYNAYEGDWSDPDPVWTGEWRTLTDAEALAVARGEWSPDPTANNNTAALMARYMRSPL